jgi:exodeoxyribonuclease V alpha subunit
MDAFPGDSFDGEVTIRRRRFANPDTGFAVLDARAGRDDLVLVGPLAHLEERERANIRGTWQDDSRFGPQVKVDVAEPLGPAGEQAVLAYLKRVRHIGESRALRLLVRHPGDTLASVDRDPRKAFRAIGLRGKQVEEAVKSWDGLRASRSCTCFGAARPGWLVARLQEHYGPSPPGRSAAAVRADERLRRRLHDRRSHSPGQWLAENDPQRVKAALVHVLVEAERNGSTCLPVGEAARQAANVTGGEPPRSACSTSSSKTGC